MKAKQILATLLISANVLAQDKPFAVPAIENWKPTKGSIELNQIKSITYQDECLNDESQYLAGFMQVTNAVSKGKGGDIHLQLCKDKKLGSEGYRMQVTPKGIVIQAQTEQGILWGVQTLQQQIKQNSSLSCGTITDTPAYPMRGFMIDVGRKYIPISYLHSLVEVMSYYKMNTLQVHLNDNGFPKHFDGNWEDTYAAFRLESDLFPELTAKDGYYTKKEFRDLIHHARKMGVEIIPEFDTPAHSLAFTHFRPSLACEEYGPDHLDLRNPAVIPFIDSLYNEYLGGEDPVFCCPRMHIGTDEYSNKDTAVVELFRQLTDHLIRKVESYGKQAVFWGSLTHAKGKTPVKADGVMMEMWYNGYADPKVMKELGYQMICIPDGYVYIVPAAGYYYDYLNCKYLYEHWTPAQIGNQLFPERDPQISGGMFALWNDICGNGISVGDIHHRVFPAIQVIAEKTWHAVNDTIGYAQWDHNRQLLGEPYGQDLLGTLQIRKDQLKPEDKISDYSAAQIGYDYKVEFDITWNKEQLGATLTQNEYARFFLSDPIGGWLGFERDGYLFTFRHKGKPGKKEHICIQGTNKSTTLFIDGHKVQELGYGKLPTTDKKDQNIIRTLVFPLAKTGSFNSKVSNFQSTKL